MKIPKINLVNSNFIFDKPIKNFTHFSLPTPILIDHNHIRVFYGKRDIQNKTLIFSFDLNLRDYSISNIKNKPSINYGMKGTFSQDGIYPSCIIKVNKIYYLFVIGYERHYENIFRSSISMSKSKDLEKFVTLDYPILDRNIYDKFFITSPFVLKLLNNFLLLYTSGSGFNQKSRDYKSQTKFFFSDDTEKWKPSKINFDYEDKINGRMTMEKFGNFFISFNNYDNGKGYNLKYNILDKNFKRIYTKKIPKNIFISDWNIINQSYPYLFKKNEKEFIVFYNGNQFGKTGIGILEGSIS